MTAPVGATISVLPGEVRLSGSAEATGVRLVNDDSAPAFKAMRTDLLYPHRQTELLAKVNKLLQGAKISGHDVGCVRKAHGIDGHPNFFYKPQYSTPQYSDAFAEWIADQHRLDPDFFLLQLTLTLPHVAHVRADRAGLSENCSPLVGTGAADAFANR